MGTPGLEPCVVYHGIMLPVRSFLTVPGSAAPKVLIDSKLAARREELGAGIRGVGSISLPFGAPWRFHDLRRTVATRLEDDLSTPKAPIWISPPPELSRAPHDF